MINGDIDNFVDQLELEISTAVTALESPAAETEETPHADYSQFYDFNDNAIPNTITL